MVAKVNAAMSAGAVVIFGVLNATYSLELGANSASPRSLGGITTSAFAYLLSERLLRRRGRARDGDAAHRRS